MMMVKHITSFKNYNLQCFTHGHTVNMKKKAVVKILSWFQNNLTNMCSWPNSESPLPLKQRHPFVPVKNKLTSITLFVECGLPKFITVVTTRTGTAFGDVRKTRCIAECPQWTWKLICKSSFIRTIIPWRTSTVLVENNRGQAIVTVKSLWANLKGKG